MVHSAENDLISDIPSLLSNVIGCKRNDGSHLPAALSQSCIANGEGFHAEPSGCRIGLSDDADIAKIRLFSASLIGAAVELHDFGFSLGRPPHLHRRRHSRRWHGTLCDPRPRDHRGQRFALSVRRGARQSLFPFGYAATRSGSVMGLQGGARKFWHRRAVLTAYMLKHFNGL